MTLQKIKQSIREAIAEDLKTGIEQSLGVIKNDRPIFSEMTHHLGRLIHLEKEIRMGLINHNNAEIRRNKIRAGVLDAINGIHRDDLKNDESDEDVSKIPTGKTGLLASMIVPESLTAPSVKSEKFVITASPLSFRRAFKKGYGYDRFLETYSDFVGIRGILQTFGLLFGFDALPEILDPEDFTKEVLLSTKMNIYCIASPKANRWTGILMKEFQKEWLPKFEFRPDPTIDNNDLRDISISLFKDGTLKHPDGWDAKKEKDRYVQDYGIIIRGPNPWFPDKMIVILAGRSSLGTEAACRAFTDPKVIAEINSRLQVEDIDLEDHRQAFRVLVSMKRYSSEGRYPEPKLDSLKIEECVKMIRKTV